MWTLFYSFVFATVVVFGASAEQRMQEGKPIFPKISGFKPEGFLPEGEHVEEVYQPDSTTAHPIHPQTMHDPGVDEYIQEWVAAYEREQMSGQVGSYTPEAPNHGVKQDLKRNFYDPETPHSLVKDPYNRFTDSFQESLETRAETVSETTGYFDINEFNLEDEWVVFYDEVTDGNLNPRGKDIISVMWGLKPGGSKAYRKAVERRNGYAERFEAGEEQIA